MHPGDLQRHERQPTGEGTGAQTTDDSGREMEGNPEGREDQRPEENHQRRTVPAPDLTNGQKNIKSRDANFTLDASAPEFQMGAWLSIT